MPSSDDRLAAALEPLARLAGLTAATTPPPDPTHRLAAAETRRDCNHEELADELEKIADELLLFSSRIRRRPDRAEIEKQLDRRDNPAPRPVHVEVDPAAWEHLRHELTRQHRGFGYAVGALVRAAIGRPRLVQGHVDLDAAQPGRRAGVYLRVSGIDDRTWSAFKAMAYTQCVTVARLVGILIEREATAVGWDREVAE